MISQLEFNIYFKKYMLSDEQKVEVINRINNNPKHYGCEFTQPDYISANTMKLENIVGFLSSARLNEEHIAVTVNFIDRPEGHGVVAIAEHLNLCIKLVGNTIDSVFPTRISNLDFTGCYFLPKYEELELF